MSKRNKDIKMTIFIMVAGIGLIIAGVIGIVTSRIDSREYKNSTDIRKIPAVIVDFSTKDDKDDSGDVRYTTYDYFLLGTLEIQGFSEPTNQKK